METKRTFAAWVPRRYSIARSPLGTLVGRFESDPIVAANRTLYLAVLLFVTLFLLNQFGWILVDEYVSQNPFGAAAVSFWLCQLGVGFLFALVIIGFKPGFEVAVSADSLFVDGDVILDIDEITTVQRVPAVRYHRELRRRLDVDHYVNRIYSGVLYIERSDGSSVVIALEPADVTELHQLVADSIKVEEDVLDLATARVA